MLVSLRWVYFFKLVFLFLSFVYPWGNLLDHMIVLFLVFWDTFIQFSTVATPIYIPIRWKNLNVWLQYSSVLLSWWAFEIITAMLKTFPWLLITQRIKGPILWPQTTAAISLAASLLIAMSNYVKNCQGVHAVYAFMLLFLIFVLLLGSPLWPLSGLLSNKYRLETCFTYHWRKWISHYSSPTKV